MIDRSAVQCLLDLLVRDCTPLDTHLRCFQAAHQHHIGILQEPLDADEYTMYIYSVIHVMYYSACICFIAIMQRSQLMKDQRRSKLVTHAVPHPHQRMLFLVALSLKAPVIQHFKFQDLGRSGCSGML